MIWNADLLYLLPSWETPAAKTKTVALLWSLGPFDLTPVNTGHWTREWAEPSLVIYISYINICDKKYAGTRRRCVVLHPWWNLFHLRSPWVLTRDWTLLAAAAAAELWFRLSFMCRVSFICRAFNQRRGLGGSEKFRHYENINEMTDGEKPKLRPLGKWKSRRRRRRVWPNE